MKIRVPVGLRPPALEFENANSMCWAYNETGYFRCVAYRPPRIKEYYWSPIQRVIFQAESHQPQATNNEARVILEKLS
jgi:hypothetical protein